MAEKCPASKSYLTSLANIITQNIISNNILLEIESPDKTVATLFLTFSKTHYGNRGSNDSNIQPACLPLSTIIVLFTVEMFPKMYVLGFQDYFLSLLNPFNFFVVLLELILTQENLMPPLGLSILRCVRLLRTFEVTR